MERGKKNLTQVLSHKRAYSQLVLSISKDINYLKHCGSVNFFTYKQSFQKKKFKKMYMFSVLLRGTIFFSSEYQKELRQSHRGNNFQVKDGAVADSWKQYGVLNHLLTYKKGKGWQEKCVKLELVSYLNYLELNKLCNAYT